MPKRTTRLNPKPGQRALRKGRASLENAAYFITARAAGQRPIFASPSVAHILIAGIRWLRDTGRIWIIGYVIIPDHVHLLLVLRRGATLSQVMQVWKGFMARELRQKCGLSPPVWQRGCYDHAIRDAKDLRVRLDYLHDNPVRKSMVETAEDYEFSTANSAYEGDVDRWWMT